ncbi:Het-C-domain-containing protein [Phellopilus nigrolimitatus]|nr:Het-C-domain-containing protein [Phellopilus nigrolimitatus]
MPSNLMILLILLVILVVCLPGNGVYAFGAGNIPSFAYMEGRAFRHGDIEDTLAEIAKKAGGGVMGAMLGKSKFGGLDIKRIYFGNWLRDYSQAVDIASLKKLQLQTIINLCMALGFLAHGYATHEFEVTEERLGVYLPTEHIDNPKGYGEGEDARKYHPKLRGPIDPRELEIDPRTGMKNYIANENGTWDTSKTLVRRTLERCIQFGRKHRSSGQKEDLYESYRLLGQALHTLEDFTAHSNFCELALLSMGHHNIFVHVGDRVRIQAPNGKSVAPLVTGTFGSSDFIHSLLGEATDHISEASVSDLNRELEKANTRSRSGPGGSDNSNFSTTVLRDLLAKVPFGNDSNMSSAEMNREINSIERIRAGPSAGGKRPEDMSPQELHAVLWQVLTFRDSIVKKIEKTIEKIPGLGPLIEKLMDSISVFVFTTLEPFLKPIMKTATAGLTSASGEVIDNHDQYEVFNDPGASDPTHSFLSKDHFNLILNEPAGKIAKAVVSYAAKQIVRAWSDDSANVHHIAEDILQCMFHPDFHNPNSQIQREMLQHMREWVQGLGNKQHSILARLSKEAVRQHSNVRAGGEGGQASVQGSAAWNAGQDAQHQLQGYISNIPGVAQTQSLLGHASSFPATVAGGAGPRPNHHARPNREGHTHGHSHGYARDAPPTGFQGSAYNPPSVPPPGTSNAIVASASGEAASFYSGSQGASSVPSGGGYHPASSFPDASSYGAPPGASPAFPAFPGAGPEQSSHTSHVYAPSYGAPPGPPPPSFGGPPFPGAEAPGGFAMPGSGQQFPNAGGFGFPDAGAYAPPPGPPGPPPFPGGSSYYSSPPPGGFQRPPGPPGGW